MKIIESVKNAIEPLFVGDEIELLDVVFVKKPDGNHLIIYIDADRPILHTDCERIHKMIDSVIDGLNPTNDESYYLDVSSYGLDMPLKTDKQMQKYIGKKIEIKLYAKVDGVKHFAGILKSFDNSCVEIETDGKFIRFNRPEIAEMTPFIEF